MSTPSTRDELKDYCLRALGHPVLKINLDDEQLEDRIDDAFIYFQQFHSEGTERTYLKHQLTANNVSQQYIEIPDNIIGVTRIFSLSGSNSTQNMFDIRYQMRLQDMQSLLSASFTYYYITQTYLSLIDMLLVGLPPIRFARHTNKLYIDWNWQTSALVGEYIIAECQSVIDPDTYPKVYNDRMLKKYAVALCKRQWGNNLKKYSGVQLPGGVTLNGQIIFDEASQEIKDIEQEIRLENELPPVMMVG